MNAKKYLNIKIEGNRQSVRGNDLPTENRKTKDTDRDLIFVLVKIGERIGEDEFFVFNQGVVQELVNAEYRQFLKKYNGVRPQNPKTTHCSYFLKDLVPYKDNWKLVNDGLGMK